MIETSIANTGIEGIKPMTKVFLVDEFGRIKETEVGPLRNFIIWRAQDWLGTAFELPATFGYESTAIAVDIPEVASCDLYNGIRVVGTILNIADTHNTLTGVLPIETSSHKAQAYRQAEASTVEGDDDQSSSIGLQKELTRYVENTVDRLFESARELYFEDGMETDFSRELVSLVKKYGNLAVGEISHLITYGRVDEEVASEALRCLARIDDASTYGFRLWVLEKNLSSRSPMVRDRAALGLVYMGDGHAIQYIRRAIEQETIIELRCDLEGALKELEVTLDATPATGNKQA